MSEHLRGKRTASAREPVWLTLNGLPAATPAPPLWTKGAPLSWLSRGLALQALPTPGSGSLLVVAIQKWACQAVPVRSGQKRGFWESFAPLENQRHLLA